MQLRIARKLVHFILFVLAIQFLSPVITNAGATEPGNYSDNISLNTKNGKNFSLLVLLSENEEKEKEGEGKEPLCLLELVDFSFVTNALTFSHSQNFYNPTGLSLSSHPLFRLYCLLII